MWRDNRELMVWRAGMKMEMNVVDSDMGLKESP
jgi:hypothetical protein